MLAAVLAGCDNATDSHTGNAKAVDTAVTPAAQTPPPPMDSAAIAKKNEEEMAKWKAYMEPAEMHKMMASWDGTWIEETTLWMGEGVQGQESKGTCVNKMLLGGRYQQSAHKGSVMNMPFEGISTMGYDNAKKIFVSSWVDNMGTGIMYTEGPYDAANKTITLKGKVVDPVTGKEKEVTEIMKIVDDNHQSLEMYEPSATGKQFKSMAIKFTRK